MRFRRGFRRGGFRKRAKGWIDGVTAYTTGATNLQSRLITMAPLQVGSTTQSAAISVVIPGDLQLHGGEDAVFTRLRGRLLFWNARQGVPSTPAPVVGGFPIRVVVAQTDVLDGTGASVAPENYLDSTGLGRDNILWFADTLVSGSSVLGTGTTATAETSTINDFWLEFDVKVKRKLQVDFNITLWFQTQIAGLGANLDFRLVGGLRTLLTRPR